MPTSRFFILVAAQLPSIDHIRSVYGDVPVFVVLKADQYELASRAIALGACDVIFLPLASSQLIHRIRTRLAVIQKQMKPASVYPIALKKRTATLTP